MYHISVKGVDQMKEISVASILVVIAIAAVGTTILNNAQAAEKTGEQLFKEHCVLCHPDGGNIVNPKKALLKKDRERNNIKTPEDIVKTMRKPGPGMTTFDIKLLSDKDAQTIAEYIVRKFNK